MKCAQMGLLISLRMPFLIEIIALRLILPALKLILQSGIKESVWPEGDRDLG